MTRAMGGWLSPAYGGALELRADLDQVEALNPEREALWARLNAATFLTEDEKRAAAGYAAHLVGASDTPSSIPASAGRPEALKYSPDQPRVPAGNSDGGQWTGGGGGGSVDALDAGIENDLSTLVLDPGSRGNGGGDRPNGCNAAFAACSGYAERLFDLGYVPESFELRQSCFVHTNGCFNLDALVQSSESSKFGISLFPPDFEKGGGGVVLHMYGKEPVYIPPATDPLTNIPPAR